ncbi:MAG: hypothetical protein GY827_06870 [Cytophagales bacterium]|nr:hypothetical protein [Cytophagales bacterium]
MAIIIYPTNKVKKVERIFLAGTIDMGNSVDWQQQVIEALQEEDVIIYNPRRPDWDSSWKEDIHEPQFNHQVNWELACLEKADLVLMYFAPNSKSPISLLETGLFKEKLLVCCPEGFYKKGNIDIVCQRYNIQQIDDLEKAIEEVKKKIKEEF